MQVLIWIFVGLAGGWLAGRTLEGNGYGTGMDLAMGVAGGVAGGSLIRAFGATGFGRIIVSAFVAVCCAALLTVVVGLVNGKTVYARNF
jgi:uncharacterized membrane protein YeaQ/YmgE (transglycosylase-associated protein family)